jgi:hypothetical protein
MPMQYVEDKEIEDARKAVVEWRKNYTKHQLLAGHKARDAYRSWVETEMIAAEHRLDPELLRS